MISSINAWTEKGNGLARHEVLYAEEPSLDILSYWSTIAVSGWRFERQRSKPTHFDQRLREISNGSKIFQPTSTSSTGDVTERMRLLLVQTRFYPWVWSVHNAPQHINMVCKEAKMREGESFTATLEEFRTSLLYAIGVAHVGVECLQTLLLRLRVLEHRFKTITDGEVVMDLHTPLSADFTFLTDLVGLNPSSLAKVLSWGCFRLYEEIAGIDIRRETERSRKIAEWANDLQRKGEECVTAGLGNEVHALAESLWGVGDHHSSRALEASYKHIFGNEYYNYWQRCMNEAQPGGLLYSFRDCKSRAEGYKGSRVIPGRVGEQAPEKQRAFLVDVISKSIEWGDVQQQLLASFRGSSPASDTPDEEDRSARESGSSSFDESERGPHRLATGAGGRTVKPRRSLHRLAGRLLKKASSIMDD